MARPQHSLLSLRRGGASAGGSRCGDRGHITNVGDVEADCGQRAQGGFTTRTGALNLDLKGLYAVIWPCGPRLLQPSAA